MTRKREKLSRITKIKLGDSTRNIQRLGGVTSRSYDGQETVRQIVKDVVADMNETSGDAPKLELGPLDAIPEEATVSFWAWSASTGKGVLSLRV